MPVNVLIESADWETQLGSKLEGVILQVCMLTIRRAPVLDVVTDFRREAIGLSVVLTNDTQVRTLNKTYRTKDKSTNVLSFQSFETQSEMLDRFLSDEPLDEDSAYIGDVILTYETIKQEAEEQEKSFLHHFTHLLVHGCLHLLGYDHEKETEANAMEAIEISILRELSIANPYE